MCAALATLLTVLSTASYRFIWATTLLAPDTFVWLTQAIGWLPGLAGFPLPDAATVLASDGVQTLPAAAQVQWSLWLIGVVVVYGVLPRLAAALLCLVVLRRRLAGLRIDPALPGHAALRDRLEPAVVSTGLDRPVDPLHEPRLSAPAPAGLDGRPVLLALELPTDLPWPPATTPAGIQIAGRTRARNAAASSTRWPTPPPRAPDRLRRPPDAGPGHAHADRRTGRARSDARLAAAARARGWSGARAAVARAARGAGPARAGRAGGIRQRAGLAGDRTWLIP